MFDKEHTTEADPDKETAGTPSPEDTYGIRRLTAISHDPPPPLLLEHLDPEGATILFGKGGIGKGSVASYWAGRLVLDEGKTPLILDYENHPTEWARRTFTLYGNDGGVRDRIHHVAPRGTDWKSRRGPIWEQVEDLKKIIQATGADYLIIDSLIPASGGADALAAATPDLYNDALQQLGLPSLSLAHVTKDGAKEYPFGSVMWHNLARLTYRLGHEQDKLLLVNCKANNYPIKHKQHIELTWHEGKFVEFHARPHIVVLAMLIDEVLTKPMTPAEITQALNDQLPEGVPKEDNYKPKTINTTLKRGLERDKRTGADPRFDKVGERYSRFGYVDPDKAPIQLDVFKHKETGA